MRGDLRYALTTRVRATSRSMPYIIFRLPWCRITGRHGVDRPGWSGVCVGSAIRRCPWIPGGGNPGIVPRTGGRRKPRLPRLRFGSPLMDGIGSPRIPTSFGGRGTVRHSSPI